VSQAKAGRNRPSQAKPGRHGGFMRTVHWPGIVSWKAKARAAGCHPCHQCLNVLNRDRDKAFFSAANVDPVAPLKLLLEPPEPAELVPTGLCCVCLPLPSRRSVLHHLSCHYHQLQRLCSFPLSDCRLSRPRCLLSSHSNPRLSCHRHVTCRASQLAILWPAVPASTCHRSGARPHHPADLHP
jgi:hypothetical protein